MTVVSPRRSYVKHSSRPGFTRSTREPVGFVGSRVLVAVLVLAAFGPYLLGPIRIEQLAVYALAPLVLFTFINLRQWAFGLLATWVAMVMIATLGVVSPYPGPLPWPPGSALAGYDNLLLPLMVMLAIWSLVPADGVQAALKTAGRVVVVASAGNALIAIASTVQPLDAYLRPFWSKEDVAVSTVAEAAQTMGRYAGVFGQPAEAGVVYSIAAVLAVLVFARRPIAMYLLITLVTVGGVLSVSKVFLLIGLPVTLLLLWSTRKGAKKGLMVAVVALIGLAIASANFIQQWDGLNYLTRLLDIPPGVSPIEFYTAGRWNADSLLMTVQDYVLGASPLVGMGAGGLTVPYDSQWTETIVVAGIFGAILVGLVFILLWRAFRRIEDELTRRTALAFWFVLVGASFGISPLTANRAATIVWVVAALFMAVSARSGGQDDVSNGLRDGRAADGQSRRVGPVVDGVLHGARGGGQQ